MLYQWQILLSQYYFCFVASEACFTHSDSVFSLLTHKRTKCVMEERPCWWLLSWLRWVEQWNCAFLLDEEAVKNGGDKVEGQTSLERCLAVRRFQLCALLTQHFLETCHHYLQCQLCDRRRISLRLYEDLLSLSLWREASSLSLDLADRDRLSLLSACTAADGLCCV